MTGLSPASVLRGRTMTTLAFVFLKSASGAAAPAGYALPRSAAPAPGSGGEKRPLPGPLAAGAPLLPATERPASCNMIELCLLS